MRHPIIASKLPYSQALNTADWHPRREPDPPQVKEPKAVAGRLLECDRSLAWSVKDVFGNSSDLIARRAEFQQTLVLAFVVVLQLPEIT